MTLEHSIGRLLTIATLVGVVALALGVVAMMAAGISPLDPAPPSDPGAVLGRIRDLGPTGLLWVGLLVIIATPPLRVAAALVGFASRGERRMALVASAVLAVIAVGIAVGLAGA